MLRKYVADQKPHRRFVLDEKNGFGAPGKGCHGDFRFENHHFFGRERNVDGEGRAMALAAGHSNVAAALLDNTVNDRQT